MNGIRPIEVIANEEIRVLGRGLFDERLFMGVVDIIILIIILR
jgi:hypothetical protein